MTLDELRLVHEKLCGRFDGEPSPASRERVQSEVVEGMSCLLRDDVPRARRALANVNYLLAQLPAAERSSLEVHTLVHALKERLFPELLWDAERGSFYSYFLDGD
jgi:hypothetical protein